MLGIFNKILYIFIETVKFRKTHCLNIIKEVTTILQTIFYFLYIKLYMTVSHESNLHIFCSFHHFLLLYLLYVMVLLSVIVNLEVMFCSEAYSGCIS